MNRAICTLVLMAVGIPTAFADGLIWQLPPDGTTVELQGDCDIHIKPVISKEYADTLLPEKLEKLQLPKNFKGQVSVTISSVGQVTRAEQKCRWIELTKRARDNEDILKVLVPEKFLTRGEDPLDHAILTFFNPKGADKAGIPDDKGFNRIQYELERFRPVFPMPLKESRQLPKKTIETPIGKFVDCEVIAGITKFDRALNAGGRWAFKSSWQIVLHPDAPFGLVQIQESSTGNEFSSSGSHIDVSSTSTLTISSKGIDAKSKLPEDSDIAGGASETSSVKEKQAEIGNQATFLPGRGLASLLLQKAVQKELNLSQEQIAKAKQIDTELRQSENPEKAQDPRLDENARQELEKDLSPEQMKRLFRYMFQRSDPMHGLRNPWLAHKLKLTPEQKNRSAEILGHLKDKGLPLTREMLKASKNRMRDEFDKLNQQHEELLEKTRQDSLKLLTPEQKAEYEKLRGEE